jgi:hypothetical protein
MKTQKSTSANVITSAVLICTLLSVSACSTKQQGSKNDGDTKVATAGIKAPEVDLHTAVLTENMEAVKQHIAAGSNLNERDPFGGSSPLITASLFGKTEMAKVLIDAGADLNFQNNDGSTALLTAAFFCRPEIVKLLLDKGADKSIKNKYGATAFQTVSGPFSETKNTYDMMGKMLEPMGLKLDYAYIQKTRPEIAEMLK